MIVAAPPGVQPWIRDTEKKIKDLERAALISQQQIEMLPSRNYTVFTDGPAMRWGSGTTALTILDLPDTSVQVTVTTGLLEVTVSGTLSCSWPASASVGFYFADSEPKVDGVVPVNSVILASALQVATSGMSYTTVFPVPNGTYRINMFYTYKTGTDAATFASVVNSTLIARGV